MDLHCFFSTWGRITLRLDPPVRIEWEESGLYEFGMLTGVDCHLNSMQRKCLTRGQLLRFAIGRSLLRDLFAGDFARFAAKSAVNTEICFSAAPSVRHSESPNGCRISLLRVGTLDVQYVRCNMSLLSAVPIRNFPSALSNSLPPSSTPRIHRGGLLIIGTSSLLLALATASECHSITHIPSLIYGLVLWGWWGLIASTLWLIGSRGPALLQLSMSRITLHLTLACVAGVAHLTLLSSLSLFAAEWETRGPAIKALTGLLTLNRFGFEILIYGFILGLIGTIQAQIRAQRDALNSLELQRQLSAAQLKALQMQLEPHFLFNTLNAITTLVELGRQQQAAEMLGHLNVILKRTLERSAPEKIPLFQELEIVENYLAIEQVRFADRLRVDIKIDPGALRSLVPCFLLQPIVENAIRHGIANCEVGGNVEASARRDGDRLHISVRNSGVGKGAAVPGNGIGLRNTRERLAYFYPNGHLLNAGPLKSGGFEVAIEVPYELAG